MGIEDIHPDVLQNIEFQVITFYRKHSDMTDYGVIRVYEALLDFYSAQRIGRQPLTFNLSDSERGMFDASLNIIDWRMGRAPLAEGIYSHGECSLDSIDIETVLLCLKRLIKSARKWNKHAGRKGYLDFISKFII